MVINNQMVTKNSGNVRVELDVWVPSLNVAFEYQGEQHYHDFVKIFGQGANLSTYLSRDDEKIQLCKSRGIKLILIPYWWDLSISSLKDIIGVQTGEDLK